MKRATVLPLGPAPEGAVDVAVQDSEGAVSFGQFRPVVEGRPIHDLRTVCEVVDRPGTPFLDATFPFAEDVDPGAKPAAAEAPPTAPPRKGPAQVNSVAYRATWERIFGSGDQGEA